MARILILFAHPRLQNSRTHAGLIHGLDKIPHKTFHDLYETYPDFDIDVEYEQELLLNHDVFVMQFPFYGREEAYRNRGFNRFTIREFMAPFEQTSLLCKMIFLPPFVIHGTHLATEKDIEQGAALYHNLLKNIAEDTMDYDNLSRMHYANEILPKPSNQR